MKRTELRRTTRVKASNPERKAENWARAYGSPERVTWVQRQPCVVCGSVGLSENAHTRTGGTSRKADACWIAPLCFTCHAELHRIGKASFEAAHQIDLDHEAAITDARWEQYRAILQEPTP